MLQEDQKKPLKFNKKGMFVISKTDILLKLKNPYLIEPLEKQAFIEFEQEKGVFDMYRMHLDADPDFNIIATEQEMNYCLKHSKQIKMARHKNI